MAAAKKSAPKKKASPAKKAAPKAKAKASSPGLYSDPELRDKLKAEITAGDKGGKPGQWSARKAQLLAAEYKKAGGEYEQEDGKKSESQQHLDQWTDEKWKTADGGPAIHKEDGETSRYLPEKACDELTPDEKEATDSKKEAGSKRGKQFVANTEAAKTARKKASAPKLKKARPKS